MKKLLINDVKNIKLDAYGHDVFLIMEFLSEDINQYLNFDNTFFPEVEFKSFSKDKKQVQSTFSIPDYIFDLSDIAYDKISSFIEKENITNIPNDLNYESIPDTQKYDYDVIPINYYYQLDLPTLIYKLNKNEINRDYIFKNVIFDLPIDFSNSNLSNISEQTFFDKDNGFVYTAKDYRLVNAERIQDYTQKDNSFILFVDSKGDINSNKNEMLNKFYNQNTNYYMNIIQLLVQLHNKFERLYLEISEENNQFFLNGIYKYDNFNSLVFVSREKFNTLNVKTYLKDLFKAT
tara:strand:- start:11833 stop:12705 length:873 start_codon:yes stop_codon:yes gene_type:complete